MFSTKKQKLNSRFVTNVLLLYAVEVTPCIDKTFMIAISVFPVSLSVKIYEVSMNFFCQKSYIS